MVMFITVVMLMTNVSQVTYHKLINTEGMRASPKDAPYVKGQINPRATAVAIKNITI